MAPAKDRSRRVAPGAVFVMRKKVAGDAVRQGRLAPRGWALSVTLRRLRRSTSHRLGQAPIHLLRALVFARATVQCRGA